MAQASDDVKTSLTSPQRKSVNIREDNIQIVEVGEKHGPLYNAIPTMPLPVAALCCVLNILVPGLGKLTCMHSQSSSDTVCLLRSPLNIAVSVLWLLLCLSQRCSSRLPFSELLPGSSTTQEVICSRVWRRDRQQGLNISRPCQWHVLFWCWCFPWYA